MTRFWMHSAGIASRQNRGRSGREGRPELKEPRMTGRMEFRTGQIC